jgi:lysozyme
MKINLINQIKSEEGCKLYAYKDTHDYYTIGYGRLIDRAAQGGISLEEAEYLLNNDITKVIAEVTDKLPWFKDLSEPRQAVLCQMSFQMGINGLMQFTSMLGSLQRGDYEGAGYQMMNSLWAKQTPNRADRLCKQMKTGEWVFK